MGREMVNLSNKLNDLEDQIKEYPELKDKYDVIYQFLFSFYIEKRIIIIHLKTPKRNLLFNIMRC